MAGDTNRLIAIDLDEASLGAASADAVHERRIAIFDLFTRNGWKISFARTSVRLTLLITLLFWIPSMVIMLRNLLINNFGLFGG